MIARAGEGSARDSLSIFDQAIAHGAGTVTAEAVRSMLGLADRARIIDLFEMLMSGDVAGALTEFRAQYDVGADPSVVLTDLADFNHLVTRLRFTPDVAEDVSLSEDERVRGREFAQKLSVRVLSRTWQMLLKGIAEVDTATRPVQAAEMLLIRLAHAADLPTLDEAIRGLDNGSVLAPRPQPDNPRPNGGGGAPEARFAADAVGASSMAPPLADRPRPCASWKRRRSRFPRRNRLKRCRNLPCRSTACMMSWHWPTSIATCSSRFWSRTVCDWQQ